MNDLRIIFMGTPDFAVPSLKVLLENKLNVVAVVTAPDKPAGRGLKIQMSPVKELGLKYNVPVLQPEKLKSPEFIEQLKSFNANLQVVVAFRMLPEVVWSMPQYGTFNLHASLLPQYRGAAPINWTIINGESETGVTTFFLTHEIDTGDIIFQEKEQILVDDNFETLYGKLMSKGSELVLKTVRAVQDGKYPQTPQVFSGELKLAPKIFKDTCKINWNQPSINIENFVRGLSPYPAAWTEVNGKQWKIYRVRIANNEVEEKREPGSIYTDNKSFLYIYTSGGMVAIEELQAEGKKRMTIGDFLRGNKVEDLKI